MSLRWSVVSLPVPARNAERSDDDERVVAAAQDRGRGSRSEAVAGAEQPGRGAGPHHDPAGCDGAHHRGALRPAARSSCPTRASAGGETGEGTDFIVSLR